MNNNNKQKFSRLSITFEVNIALWLRIYLKALYLYLLITGTRADRAKVDKMLKKGIKVVRVSKRKNPCVLIA